MDKSWIGFSKHRMLILDKASSWETQVRSSSFPLGWILLYGSFHRDISIWIHLHTQVSKTSASIEDSTLTDVSLETHGLISDLPARSQGVHGADAIAQGFTNLLSISYMQYARQYCSRTVSLLSYRIKNYRVTSRTFFCFKKVSLRSSNGYIISLFSLRWIPFSQTSPPRDILISTKHHVSKFTPTTATEPSISKFSLDESFKDSSALVSDQTASISSVYRAESTAQNIDQNWALCIVQQLQEKRFAIIEDFGNFLRKTVVGKTVRDYANSLP